MKPASDYDAVTRTRTWLSVALGAWLLAAIGAGWAGVWEPWPRPVLQVAIALATAACLFVVLGTRGGRAAARSIPIPALVGLHITRFVGVWFLILEGRGRIPAEWATLAGWGDIAVAALAVVVLGVGSRGRAGGMLLWIWNTVGLVDILLVVGNAVRLGLRDPASIVELTRLPLCVVVTWLVPLIIVSHIVIYARLTVWRSPPRPAATTTV